MNKLDTLLIANQIVKALFPDRYGKEMTALIVRELVRKTLDEAIAAQEPMVESEAVRQLRHLCDELVTWSEEDELYVLKREKCLLFSNMVGAVKRTVLTAQPAAPSDEGREAWRDPLQKLLDYADAADDAQYGTLKASLVRELVNEALAAQPKDKP